MRHLEVKKYKETGVKWVTPAFEVETQIGTATVYFSGVFYRGYTSISIGIQAYSKENWIIPSGYSFWVDGFEHNLAIDHQNPQPDGSYLLNVVHPHIIQENKTNTFKALLGTPYGDILFDIEVHSAHRKQYVAVKTSEIPNGVQLREDTI